MDDTQRAVFNDRQRQAFDKSYTYFLVPLPQDVIDRMGRIIAAATIRAGETVLDVGTGTGALIPQIRTYRPGRIVACDLSANMLEQVAERYPEVERHQCDIADLSLPAECVDVVFMNGMYGNIADKSKALGNIVRMLRRGRPDSHQPPGRAGVCRTSGQDRPLPDYAAAQSPTSPRRFWARSG